MIFIIDTKIIYILPKLIYINITLHFNYSVVADNGANIKPETSK